LVDIADRSGQVTALTLVCRAIARVAVRPAGIVEVFLHESCAGEAYCCSERLGILLERTPEERSRGRRITQDETDPARRRQDLLVVVVGDALEFGGALLRLAGKGGFGGPREQFAGRCCRNGCEPKNRMPGRHVAADA